jgi:hypothetical protein
VQPELPERDCAEEEKPPLAATFTKLSDLAKPEDMSEDSKESKEKD